MTDIHDQPWAYDVYSRLNADLSQSTELETLAKIMSQPHRLEIIQWLLCRPCCVSGLASLMDLEECDVSGHLRRLRRHGLVRYCRHGKEHIYQITDILRTRCDRHTFCVTIAAQNGFEFAISGPMPRQACIQTHIRSPKSQPEVVGMSA